MKRLTKTFSVVFIVVILSSIIILPANAATDYTRSASNDFNDPWYFVVQCYNRYDGNNIAPIGVIKWGFNKHWINEDYTHTTGYTGSNSTAKVQRVGKDSDYQSGPTKIAGIKSIIEVTHKTNTVYYRMTLSYNIPAGHTLYGEMIDYG